MSRTALRILILAAVALAIGSYFLFDLGRFLSLDFVRERQAALEGFTGERPILAVGIYAAVYIAAAALSLPGAAILTLVGGALFGLLWGTIIVSFASTIGATIAFLLARFLFRDAVQRRFGGAMQSLNDGIERDGPLYLFMIRLVPVFPFFVVNLAMALTPIRLVPFFLVSQIGMLPGTAVYVNAGTQLARIDSLGGILSPGVIGAFVLLGLFPLVATWLVRGVKRRRVLRGWKRPSSFDRNLIVIGAGSAGLVTAYIAAAVKAGVTLIERGKMGGDCLNTGCVPSKALIRSAHFVNDVRRHQDLGIREASSSHDFGEIMARVNRVVETIAPHDSPERYEGLGVEVIQGEARITGPWSVEVGGRTLTARNLVVATGAGPAVPPIPGLDEVGYLTSDTLWDMKEHPGRLLVLGGGPIGCELAQAFQRLGAEVTQLEMSPRLLQNEDADVAAVIEARLRSEGVQVRTGWRAVRFEVTGEGKVAVAEPAPGSDEASSGDPLRIPFDTLLVAVGRKANIRGFGLEEVGVEFTDDGRIRTDAYLQTRVPSIHAAGDCVGPYQFTHAASHQAWYAAVNSLFRNPFKRFKVDYRHLPHATFTDPEVARVGLSEAEATKKGVAHEVVRYNLSGLDRAITDESAQGFVKVLTPPGKDRILGVTIVGPSAGELIAEYTLAMKHGIGLNGILGTVHTYPTLAEANKFAAGAWKRANAPQGLLRWVERYHAWRRG
ncbi:bifunctional TVP38/TMEM64 family protein/FAD-dependent oxidoreductase [soil metagenome]